jgi:predicted neutral ceramidase superfamily lipid hydrolase
MISMALKQFLKPNWRKVVIFLLMSLIMSFTLLFFIGCGPRRGTLGTLCVYSITDYLTVIVASPLVILLNYFLGVFHVFVLSFIYWYLLSCLIIWIYDKFRGKKK